MDGRSFPFGMYELLHHNGRYVILWRKAAAAGTNLGEGPACVISGTREAEDTENVKMICRRWWHMKHRSMGSVDTAHILLRGTIKEVKAGIVVDNDPFYI